MSNGGALIGYARASIADQDMSLQFAALEHAGCAKIYMDVAREAKAVHSGYEELMAYLRPSDTLVVWKLDRLGRSLSQLMQRLDALRKRGIDLRVTADPAMDTTTPDGKLFFHLVAVAAEFEGELIRERTKAGLKVAKARGRQGGRKPVVTPSILARANKLLADNPTMSVREAANALHVGKTTLYKALKTSGGGHGA